MGLDLASATDGRARLSTAVDPHLRTPTPQRAEIVLVDGLLGLGAATNAGWPR